MHRALGADVWSWSMILRFWYPPSVERVRVRLAVKRRDAERGGLQTIDMAMVLCVPTGTIGAPTLHVTFNKKVP